MEDEYLKFEYNGFKFLAVKEDIDGFYRIARDTWNDNCYIFYSIVKGNSLNDSVKNFIEREGKSAF